MKFEDRDGYATPEQVESMLAWLESKRDGATIHTINKAKSYLSSLSADLQKPINTYSKHGRALREEMFISLVRGIRIVMETGDIEYLDKKVMRCW